MTVTGRNKVIYCLDKTPIGSGGEGDIFHAHIKTTRAAKIYKPGVLTQELENKLEIMIENPPNESVLSQVAWPLDLIYNDNSQCIGFTMPELSINAELGEIYKYPSTLPISVHQKIIIAQNICVVISEVHKAGYVFGDFNPRNIGLDVKTGLVSFLDTDTYHVVDLAGGKTYRCNVCAPGYAAPELLTRCSDYIAENPLASKNAYAQTPLPTFTKETDNFALAIHVFKLLMNGYTPFGGIIETAAVSQASPGVGDMAVRRDSYCFKPGYKPQSVAIPALDAFPQEIADMFARAFIAGRRDPKQRPNAAEWHGVLSKYAESLATCQSNPLHQYGYTNEICPYCEADRRFLAVVSEDAFTTFALKQTTFTPPPTVAKKQIVQTPAQMPAPTKTTPRATPVPTHKPKKITIRGKSYSTTLSELFLQDNGLENKDIVPLMYMTELTTLSLWGNQISDLTPLSGLTNLRRLYLGSNQIINLEPLSKLANLRELELTGNQINSIAPLSGLGYLQLLFLEESPISDWSPVTHVAIVEGRPNKVLDGR